MPTTKQLTRPSSLFFLIVVLIFASNLRTPFTSLAPLIAQISDSLHMSQSQMGILVVLPLLAFTAVSPFAAGMAKRYGLERSLFAALIILLAGIVLRSTGPVWALYAGTTVVGCAIAIGNVLIPGLIKRDFAHNVSSITALYALTMGVAAAIGSVAMIPLSQFHDFGWQFALGSLGILPLLTIFLWLPQLKHNTTVNTASQTAHIPTGARIWHSAIAWQVTMFMGLNSYVYYCISNWLPTMLMDVGYTSSKAASLLGLLHLMTALPGLFLIPLLRKVHEQKWVAALAAIATLTTIMGFAYKPDMAIVWVIIYGLSSSTCMILALAFSGLRTKTPHQAATLAGMAQSIGYCLAAIGPSLMGFLHDTYGNWDVSYWLLMFVSIMMALFGFAAGRNKFVPL